MDFESEAKTNVLKLYPDAYCAKRTAFGSRPHGVNKEYFIIDSRKNGRTIYKTYQGEGHAWEAAWGILSSRLIRAFEK